MAADAITFTHGGKIYKLSRGEVLRAVGRVSPEPIRTHWVEINGVRYPVKQVFAKATRLDRLDFATNQARNQLRRLGFVVGRTDDRDERTIGWNALVDKTER